MNINFCFNITALDEKYEMNEISFLEYRSFVKTIIDNDEILLNNAFNSILNRCCVEKVPENSFKKFLVLLKLRTIIIDPVLEIANENSKINLDINNIFNTLNKKYDHYKFEVDGDFYYFDFPSLLIPKNNMFDLVMDCLVRINDIKLNPETKTNIVENLPALPVNEIYKNLIDHYKDYKYYIKPLDFTLNLFDYSCITFLKSIFSYNLKNLYDIEYALRKHLHYTAIDFGTFSLPECNIALTTLTKELNEMQRDKNKVEYQQSVTN